MGKKLLVFLLQKINKILEKFEKEEPVVEEKEVKEDSQEKKNSKFFGKDTLFDEAKTVLLAIIPIEKYFPEKYNEFKEKLDKLIEESKTFYEEKECKNELTLKLTIGTSSYSLELYEKFYNLLENVNKFKKEEYNYVYSFKSLEELKKYLINVYYKLIAGNNNKNTDLLTRANKTLINKLNEISNLDVEENTFKEEELCKSMCECIFIFLKCNARCDYYCSYEEFCNAFSEESDIFWDIFLENVKDLSKKTEIFKDCKYYNRYHQYLQAILEKDDVDYSVLINQKFLKRFVENEKKIIELYHYYKSIEEDEKSEEAANLEECKTKITENSIVCDEVFSKTSDDDMINPKDLEQYIRNFTNNSSNSYNETISLKLSLFAELIRNFKYDITSYEVYKLVYFFGLKSFFVYELVSSSQNDLLKKVFVLQKDTKIAPLKKLQNTENEIFYKLVDCDLLDECTGFVKKTLNNLKINFEICENGLEKIYFSAHFFKDCENIMKNLNELEKLS